MTCTVVRERNQLRLYDAVHRASRSGEAVAVLDPTWPEPFLGAAIDQVEAAVAVGHVGRGDLVVFSSGSTGQPRGVVRTVDSWQASVGAFGDVAGISAQDTVWLTGPLWSSLFLYGAFHAGAVGARMLFRDDDPATATALHCVPSQLPALLRRADDGGLPLLRRVVVAGDHCPASLTAQGEAAGWRVVEYYGAAELSFVAWREDGGPLQAFPGVQAEVRQGLLWARSRYLARGYLTDDPTIHEATLEGTREAALGGLHQATDDGIHEATGRGGPLRFDRQGWATVSDLAREVPGGLEVLGRGNSAVTSAGHTVVVEEVERLLQGLPDVDEVAVLGMPDPRWGQLLTAVVVGPAADGTLRAAVAGMPAPSRPRRWLHTQALPRTSGGKLRRDALPGLVTILSQR